MGITETKIDSNFDDNELLGNRFTVYRNDRKQGAGGVLIAIRNSSPINIIRNIAGPGESLMTTVSFFSQVSLDIVILYRPPSEYNLVNLHGLLSDRNSRYPLILFGDLNLPDIDWTSGLGQIRRSSVRQSFHQEALDIFKCSDLSQLVRDPTHIKGNTLDLFFVENSLFDQLDFDTLLQPGISDHDMIITEVQLPNSNSKTNHDKCVTRYNFSEANYEEIDSLFFELLLRTEQENLSAQTLWEIFKNTTLSALKEFVPTLLSRPRGKPWMSRSLLRNIRKRDRAYQVYKKYPTQQNFEYLKGMKIAVKTEVSNSKTDFIECHITNELKVGNTKPLYNMINKSRGKSNNISCLENTDPEGIANSLADFFSSVFNETTFACPDFSLKSPPVQPMSKICIDIAGVKNLVTNLDVRKATGPDKISSYCLKEFSKNVPKFLPVFVSVLRASLEQSHVPLDWKLADIVPIFKSGRRDLPQNYRPISLTSITSKIIEHIISSSMWQHLSSFNLLSDNQHGFRKHFSTTTQLLDVTHFASKALAERREYHIVSFDFAKAFDKVPHQLLIHKLKAYRFDTGTLKWIEAWLRNRASVVQVNGYTSHNFSIKSGVPQGSVLGPLLFILYIDDLPLCVKDADCRLYADDTLLCMDLTNTSQLALQTNVTALQHWATQWGMTFNPEKCTHMQVGRSTPDFKLFMNGIFIPQANGLKYLGVFIQSDIKWHEHILNITKKSNKALGLIRRCLFNASISTKIVAYNTIVRPLLEYACQVWSPHAKGLTDKLETIQRRGVRWIFRLGPMDSVTECMRVNSIQELKDRREDLDLKFLKRIVFGLYDLDLNNYISFNPSHQTRHGVVHPHFRIDQYKHSFYNRMAPNVVGQGVDDSLSF